jgi:hypothetical protein
MRIYALLLFLIGTIAFSCQKDDNDDDPDAGKSRIELITSATWRYDTIRLYTDNDGEPDIDLPDEYRPSCLTDNTLTFHAGGHGVHDEGASKCDDGDPQSTDFSWEFKDNENVLSSPDPIFGGFSGDSKITVLTSSKMQLQREMTVPLFGTVNIVLDLKH